MGKKKQLATKSRKKSRKEKRKEERMLKKAKKNEHYFKRFKKEPPKHPSSLPRGRKEEAGGQLAEKPQQKHSDSMSEDEVVIKPRPQEKSLVEKIREASEKSKVLAEKRKVSEKRSRIAQLREANKAEDKQIKHLATLMKMNKRRKKGKTPALPKVFTSDGLDYLLDVTDPDKLKDMKYEEPSFEDDEEDFEKDLAMVKGGLGRNTVRADDSPAGDSSGTEGSQNESEDDDDLAEEGEVSGDDDISQGDGVLCGEGESEEGDESEAIEDAVAAVGGDVSGSDEADSEDESAVEDASSEGDQESDNEEIFADDASNDFEDESDNKDADSVSEEDFEGLKSEASLKESKQPQKRKLAEEPEGGVPSSELKTQKKKMKKGAKAVSEDGVWEDIYGRMRGRDGSVLTGVGSTTDGAQPAAAVADRYVPPALRAQQMALSGDKRAELAQLRRRLQGQLNRLSARSARGVLALVEELYAGHSRHDTSQTLTQLVHEVCVAPAAVRPDRLLMEHVLLVAALHANVGTEVGAHFLLKTAQRFHKLLMSEVRDDDSKELDNLVMLLAHLYTFRVTDSRVVYDVLKILVERFSAKDVELILTALRSVGFTMRKDDPAALKELIMRLQARAAASSGVDAPTDGSRIRFLLNIVMALRNNNMNKIPQYDPSLGQELTKLLKTLVNPNHDIAELSVSLEDLLKAEERGKWWVVGSAWSGTLKERQPAEGGEGAAAAPAPAPAQQRYSAELLELARRQRMNTDLRRNVFCVLMTAEDYLDGFERLMRLGLKGAQQEQEMVTVVLGCCLRERAYNAYYSHLLDRLCGVDRKYQMRVKVAVWEHLKQLTGLGSGPASNLAKTLAHLISGGQLTIAVLKVVEFSEMSKPMVRFLRQLLLSLLLQAEKGAVRDLFQRAAGPQLKRLRDSLVLFLHHFVLRNRHKLADAGAVETLEGRARAAVAALKAADGALRL